MAAFLLVHGAMHGGWCWRRLTPYLEKQGHEVFTPTLTGMGERSHLLTRETGLYTHVEDMLGVLKFEDLSDVIVVGHSYAGLVITQLAESASGRIQRLVYLAAFLAGTAGASSMSGKSNPGVLPGLVRVWATAATPSFRGFPGRWGWPTRTTLPGLPTSDRFPEVPLWYAGPEKARIRTTAKGIHPLYTGPMASALSLLPKRESKRLGDYGEIDAGHDVMVTDPGKLAESCWDLRSQQPLIKNLQAGIFSHGWNRNYRYLSPRNYLGMAVLPARIRILHTVLVYSVPQWQWSDIQAQCISFPLDWPIPDTRNNSDLCESYPVPDKPVFPFGTAISNRAPSPGSLFLYVISFIDRIPGLRKTETGVLSISRLKIRDFSLSGIPTPLSSNDRSAPVRFPAWYPDFGHRGHDGWIVEEIVEHFCDHRVRRSLPVGGKVIHKDDPAGINSMPEAVTRLRHPAKTADEHRSAHILW